MRAMRKSALVPVLGGLLLSAAANADVRVPPFFPSLPPTASLAPEVASDVSKKGYHVAEINRSGTYLITDGGSQAWAIVTQRGVILVDVPEPLPFRLPLRAAGDRRDHRQADHPSYLRGDKHELGHCLTPR